MADEVKKTASLLAKMGAKSGVQPQGDESAGIDAKNKFIDEYKKATEPVKAAPATPTSTASMDKVNTGKYGSKPGENRIDVSNMTKPLGSYKDGTDYVPKTGNYKLHEGEAVKSKKENMLDHLKDALAGAEKPEKPKKEIKAIHTRKVKGKDGKSSYIHEHHHTHPEVHPMEEHVSADHDSMIEHMMQHMGEPNEGENEAEAGQSGIEEQGEPNGNS
jgi:hypothetical protein